MKKWLVETRTGKPFFWLGDTGWELFHRLTREQALYYLDVRKKQGFNIIQAVALAENNGIRTPNRYGDLPFRNEDPTDWATTEGADPRNAQQYDYWDHLDFVISEAAKRGLYIGLLPTWGDKVAHLWGEGPVIFNEANAFGYAKNIAQRYRKYWNIVWVLGGDRPAVYEKDGKKFDERSVWRAMAKGIEVICGPEAFITYHPSGGAESSAAWFHTDPWLDMNALQSGHGNREVSVWDYIRRDLQLKPQKPVLDMEPCYEDHPVNPWDGKWTRSGRGYFTAAEIRGRIYRGIFAGACGVTYGHHSVWQFLDTALYQPIYTGDMAIPWQEALNREVANQLQYLKKLMLSMKSQDRIEDSLLIASDRGSGYRDLIMATKAKDGAYAMVYIPQPHELRIDGKRLKKGSRQLTWFNPATGSKTKARYVSEAGMITTSPPDGNQPDWVLIIQVL